MSERVSLRELMGKSASDKSEQGLKLKDLPDILGDALPEMPKNNIGRFRLVRALQQRFGSNFRTLPGVKGLLKEFDDDVEFEGTINKLKGIKPKGSK